MRKVFLVLVMALFVGGSYAQNHYGDEEIPLVQLGFSTGINNMVGLIGPHINVSLTDNFILEAGVGLGSWGSKSNVNIQYHPDYFRGVFYKIGYSNSSGFKDYEVELELDNGKDEDVMMDLNSVDNLNLTVGNSWKLGRKSRFYLEGGYSICLTPSDDTYTIHDEEIELSSTSKTVMNIVRPGGLVFGLGLSFGL